MEEYLPVLQNTALFAGLSAPQLLEALACLGAQKRSYGKGEAIFHAGQRISCMGVLLCGQVHIQREDHWGNRSLLAEIGPGELFGEAYAVGEEPMCNDAGKAWPCCWIQDACLRPARLPAGCTPGCCNACLPYLRRKTVCWRKSWAAFRSAPHGKNCCITFRNRPKRRAGEVFPFRLTASNWPITFR